jgi:hypothetical protein
MQRAREQGPVHGEKKPKKHKISGTYNDQAQSFSLQRQLIHTQGGPNYRSPGAAAKLMNSLSTDITTVATSKNSYDPTFGQPELCRKTGQKRGKLTIQRQMFLAFITGLRAEFLTPFENVIEQVVQLGLLYTAFRRSKYFEYLESNEDLNGTERES